MQAYLGVATGLFLLHCFYIVFALKFVFTLQIFFAPMYCLCVPIPIFADEKLVLQHKDGHALALVQSRQGEEGRGIFFACGVGLFFSALPTEENCLSAATVLHELRSNQGSARRGGTEWRALYFVLCLPGLLSAWRKFMLSLCPRKSARPVGDHYLQGACRQRRLSPRALGTMRYPCARPGFPASSLQEPRPRPSARELLFSSSSRGSLSRECMSHARSPYT